MLSEVYIIYIYYILCDNKHKLEEGYMGACHKNLSLNFLTKFELPIPKNKDLLKKLEPLYLKLEEYKINLDESKLKYEEALEELKKESIKS